MLGKTEVRTTTFANKPLIQIKEFDCDGEEVEKSLIQFGIKKAEAVIKHIEEIKKFVADNKK